MARYIDANAFQKKITEVASEPDYRHEGEDWRCGVNLVGVHLDRFPTADVAPRAEVRSLQSQVNRLERYDEERDIALHARLISETRRKVAREIFAEIEEYFGMYNVPIFLTRDNFAKLKEKYGGSIMDDTKRECLKAVCKRFGITYPTGMGRFEIKPYIESKLREIGLSEYEIRQVFSSDWELLVV